ncbi:MAG: twin transmembrane helix small protein [Pseudomonadota bacterium]
MSTVMFFLALVAMGAVAIVLLMGLKNLLTQGDVNLSNKLMQARVFLQFVAVVIIVVGIIIARQATG